VIGSYCVFATAGPALLVFRVPVVGLTDIGAEDNCF
jgi:hypothetical protein